MKNKITRLLALFVILAVGFSSLNGMAIAANNQVNPTGDTPDEMLNDKIPNFTISSVYTIYVPDEYSTIQAAIDNASHGDTIIVRDGTYTENIVVDKRLTIESENGSDLTLVQAQNSSYDVFDVRADYVNISGFTVKGASGYPSSGIYLGSGIDHCNITDNKALDNHYGIYLYQSSNNTLSNNTANSNNGHGIRLYSSSSNTIVKNTANSNNYTGIFLHSSSNNNTLSNNTANSNNDYGIWLYYYSDYNTIASNTASNNDAGIFLYYYSNDNTITDNTANSNKYNGIGLSSSNSNTISSNTASNNEDGIWLYLSNNNTLSSNTASNNSDGICLDSSSNNTLSSNTANSNNNEGIYLWVSSKNTISNNTASNNWGGIYLGTSSNNTISNNTFNSNNYTGICLFDYSSNNTISNNNASNNSAGILFYSSSNNIISSNTALNNYDGIRLDFSSNNTIYNNYFNNTNNAYDFGNNIWNISKTLGTNIIGGPYLGGNYWSDYAGFDMNGDGLGDILLPYNSSGNIQNRGDYLPLVSVGVTEADLVGKSAWPEHHHFVLSKDGNPGVDDKDGTPGNQTLYGQVGNTGTLNLSSGTYKVVWDIVDQEDISVGSYETLGTLALSPGDKTTLTYDLDVSTFDGKYSVTAQCYYCGIGGDKIKSFSFAVVP